MGRVAGKIALVTGAASGLDEASAQRLARAHGVLYLASDESKFVNGSEIGSDKDGHSKQVARNLQRFLD